MSPKETTEDESYSLLPKEATEDESYSESPEEQSYAPNWGDNVVQNNIMTSESESREKSDKNAEYSNYNFETTKKLYTCSLCTKSFTQNDTMIIHMQTHNKEKTFTCILCSKSFSFKSKLSRHMRILNSHW